MDRRDANCMTKKEPKVCRSGQSEVLATQTIPNTYFMPQAVSQEDHYNMESSKKMQCTTTVCLPVVEGQHNGDGNTKAHSLTPLQ